MFTNPVTGEQSNGIKKVRYSHDAMIDLMIAEPAISQNAIAAHFGRTPGWISVLINSDAFQARLTERRKEVVDPIIQATINDRLQAVAAASLERVLERLTGPIPATDDFALKTAQMATQALGYGARSAPTNNVQVAVVVQVPSKSTSPLEWVQQHSPFPQP